MNKRSTVIPLLAALVLALAPAAAQAHALGLESDPNRPVAEYLWLGFLHMVTGHDHLLFIAGILLLAGGVRDAAKLISLFVAGHSLTLLIATIAGWKLNATPKAQPCPAERAHSTSSPCAQRAKPSPSFATQQRNGRRTL